jgi:hypothetical protein
VNTKVTVPAGSLQKVYLPWVTDLKGPQAPPSAGTVLAQQSAYHLVSSVPVVVYQFNPLEFKAAGGPTGKNWSTCQKASPIAPDCYSYSNDASLLLPSTAMTGTYRVMGPAGWSRHPVDLLTGKVEMDQPVEDLTPSVFAVTGTQDDTNVTVKLGAKADVIAGNGISAQSPGGTLTFKLAAGDVALVTTSPGRDHDVSGSLLTADKPVQVITGTACSDMPFDVSACDHLEETVFPAETLGKHYVVNRPTGPSQNDVAQVVRFYGNVDGTTLDYKPSAPDGCPTTLAAGEVAECTTPVDSDFEVSGSSEFAVGMYMLGGTIVDPNFNPKLQQPQGDPSQSFAVTVEQYRKRYVFLAPADYNTNYVDIVGPASTTLTLDGQDVSSEFKPISGTEWYLARVKLGPGKQGTHVLEATQPIGIQVLGYGDNTSYQYPGGLNLGQIAPAPVK